MATISITEILGSDNIASSRAVIANNFKTLCDEANKIETFLNTSVTGASLNVAEAYINQNGTVQDIDIFTVNGRASIEKLLTAKGGISCAGNFEMITSNSTATLQNVVISGDITSNGALTTNALVQTIDTSNTGNLANTSALVLTLSGSEGSPSSPSSPTSTPTATLFGAQAGQLVTVIFNGDATEAILNIKETSTSEISHTITLTFGGDEPKITDATLVLLFTSTTDVKVISSTNNVEIA